MPKLILIENEEEKDCNCDVVFESDVETESFTIESEKASCSVLETCEIRIHPQEHKAIFLKIEEYSYDASYLDIFTFLPEAPTQLHFLARRGYSDYRKKEYTTGINVGMMLRSTTSRYHSYGSEIKMKFERISDTDRTCDPLLVVVGEEEVVIQEKKQMTIVSGCNYLVVPKVIAEGDDSELLFTVNTDQYVTFYNAEDNMEKYDKIVEDRSFRMAAEKLLIVAGGMYYDKNYETARITARFIGDTCLCKNDEISLDRNTTSLTIHSPGFPKFSCPGIDCTKTIQVEKTNVSGSTGIIALSGFYDIGPQDHFRVSGRKEAVDSRKKESVGSDLENTVYISENDLKIELTSDKSLNTREYKVYVERMLVKNECLCSLYNEKEPTNDGNLVIHIPEYCHFVFCHWRSQLSIIGTKLNMAITVLNGTDADVVEIENLRISHRLFGSQLSRQKKISTSRHGMTHIFFKRHPRDTENHKKITLKMEWNVVTAPCECGQLIHEAKVETPFVLTSTGYPENYCGRIKCVFDIRAPNDTFFIVDVDEIDTENFHDYVDFYNENNEQIKSFSGRYMNTQFNTTSNVVKMVFRTDQNEQMRGYHIHFKAVQKPREVSSSLFNTILIVILATVIAGCICIVAVFVKKQYQVGNLRNNANQSVRYSASSLSSAISGI